MPLDSVDEHVATLTELGLSSLQAKIYLSLAKSGDLPAEELSRNSQVARPDVYRVLAELEKSGLIERIISKPTRFRVAPVERCISSLLQKRILKTAELQRKTLSLVDQYERGNKDERTSENFQFVLIPARDPVYTKAERMLRNVQTCVCLLGLSKRMIAWLSNYEPLLEEALARKVECRMIMPGIEDNWYTAGPFDMLVRFPTFFLRVIPNEPRTGFSVWDHKEILLSTSAVDSPYPHPTLWSNNKAVVDLAQDHFDMVWEKARKPKKIER